MGGGARAKRRLGVDGGVKLLLDQNLSRRLVPALQERFPGSSQVMLLGLERASDSELWEYAREHGFVFVTKDDDFRDLQTLRGFPPKLIMLRLGNCTNQQVLDAVLGSADRVLALLQQDTVGAVEVG